MNSRDRPFINAHIRRLGLHARKKMFDLVAHAHLGSFMVEMLEIESGETKTPLYLIDNQTPTGDHLIDITYMQV